MCLGRPRRPERYEDFDGGSADYLMKMLARLMPGPSGKDAQLPHLRLLAPAVRQMVFPVLAAADHQTAVIAAEPPRRDYNIGDCVILPADHHKEVVPLLEPTQSGTRFLSSNLPTVACIAEVIQVHPAAVAPFLGAQLDKLQYLAYGKFANHCLLSFSIYARSSSSSSILKLVVASSFLVKFLPFS
jgi:hypothetical protein